MGSIYKKGRDGYYYYQTYTFNPESGKKNKRIFHSLSTKSLDEAKKKKIILDKKYEKLSQRDILNNKRFFLASAITLLILTFYFSKTLYYSLKETSIQEYTVHKIEEKNTQAQKAIIISNQKKKSEVPKEDLKKNESLFFKSKIENTPNYTIERVQNISSSLKQVKIFLTVEDSISSESIKLLCESITNEYSSFSNIIISVYDNSENGIALAQGIKSKLSLEDEIKSWIAFFTYNVKEGSFFDDTPSKFLRNN